MLKRKPKLVQVDPDLDRAELTRRFVDLHEGSLDIAADLLSVDRTAVFRWTKAQREPPATAVMIMQELIRKLPKVEDCPEGF